MRTATIRLLLVCASLSLPLAACSSSKGAGNLVRPEISTEVPKRYKLCAELTKLPAPKGGWTPGVAYRALLNVRASEVTKRDCILDLIDYTEGLLHGIRG